MLDSYESLKKEIGYNDIDKLHCIFSSNITEEVKYSPNLVFMDINSLPITWANQMIKTEYKNRKSVRT